MHSLAAYQSNPLSFRSKKRNGRVLLGIRSLQPLEFSMVAPLLLPSDYRSCDLSLGGTDKHAHYTLGSLVGELH